MHIVYHTEMCAGNDTHGLTIIILMQRKHAYEKVLTVSEDLRVSLIPHLQPTLCSILFPLQKPKHLCRARMSA